MEQLNRIEIRGYVGNVAIHRSGEKVMARITVATSTAYKDRDGSAVIDTTWHQIVAFEGKAVQDLERLEKGSKVYIAGRMRNSKYTAADGSERTTYEVIASKLQLLEDEEPFSCEV